MNQFNMNWMFPPPNLFGMRAPNRNGSQFTGQPFSEGMRGEDKDMSENAPHMDTDGSEDISEMPGTPCRADGAEGRTGAARLSWRTGRNRPAGSYRATGSPGSHRTDGTERRSR